MPRIGLILPGVPRSNAIEVADEYTITVTRGDGIACTDIEAKTAMAVFAVTAAGQGNRRGKDSSQKAPIGGQGAKRDV